MERISRLIDSINSWTGRVVGFAIVLIMFIQVMEVVLRYIFNNPTIWAWDVNEQLFVSSTILAGGYALLHDEHVRVDILYGRLDDRKKAVFEVVTFPLLFLAFALLTWQTAIMAWSSWQIKERSWSYFSPPIYQVKMATCLAAFLLLLQIVSRGLKNISSIRKKDENQQEVE